MQDRGCSLTDRQSLGQMDIEGEPHAVAHRHVSRPGFDATECACVGRASAGAAASLGVVRGLAAGVPAQPAHPVRTSRASRPAADRFTLAHRGLSSTGALYGRLSRAAALASIQACSLSLG